MSEQIHYIQYLEQPEKILQADVDVLHSWIERYPYVPILRVILAAKYQSEDHRDAAKYLEEAAFYVQDRKQLKLTLRNWNDIFKSHQLTDQEEDIIPSDETLNEIVEDENNFIPPLEKEEVFEELDIELNEDLPILSENEEKEVEALLSETSEIIPEETDTPIILDQELQEKTSIEEESPEI